MFGPWYLAAIHNIDGWGVPRGTGHAPGRSQERLFSKDNALITERLQRKNAQSRRVANSTSGAQGRRYTGRGRSLPCIFDLSTGQVSGNYRFPHRYSIDRGR
jgi:hypothetical protein